MTDTEILDALSEMLTENEGASMFLRLKTGVRGFRGWLKIEDVCSNEVSKQPTLREALEALLE